MSTQAQTSTGINLNGANQDPSAAPSATPAISAVPVGTSATVTSTTPSNQDSLGVGSNLGVNSPTANPTPGAGASTGGTKGGTNAGIIAGAAVGAAIGAAILTFLITFMFLKKKNHKERRHGKRRDESGGISTYSEKALPKDLSRHDEAALAASAWQKHLPQSADDNTIRSAVKTLFDQVELHVENFYRDMAVPMTEELQSELQRVDSPHLSESIVALLPRARSQTALIKHCLLSYIVASISIDDNSVQSLLPSDYATLPQLARAPGQKKPGFDPALAQWRVLSAYLRPAPSSDPTYLSQRDQTVSAAATAFTSAFSPWAGPSYRESARRQNVADIFQSAAEVGILIFSQPSSFVYEWSAGTGTGTGRDHRGGGVDGAGSAVVVVVTPAFLKVRDEHSVMLERGQVMIAMATQSI